MIYELSQKFFFDAAHTLNRNIDAAGSRRIHGHTYHAEVSLIGEPDAKSGMLQDLGSLRRNIEAVRELLDHQFLDDVPDLGPATLENLCKFIFTNLVARCPHLVAVSVERPASGDKCVLRKERLVLPSAERNVQRPEGTFVSEASASGT
ncbi:6-carboxytetrahydropterin synthase [Variovorax brevis]|uniref:6-carboxytetrahydropterin synthase n=1 Tax=Variovorax brevis TaxID=3053503 RepID=UPI003365784A